MQMNFIAGKWVTGNSATANVNPSDTCDVIGEYSQASTAQVSEAITAAHAAFPAWAATTPQQRADVLDVVGLSLIHI